VLPQRLELGCPGGWSQYAAKLLRGKCRIIALDILPMDDIVGVEFIHGDFSQDAVLTQLTDLLGDGKVDLVLSDMAPNMSGIAVDHDRSMYLVELAVDFANQHLAPRGDFLTKVFQVRGFQPFMKQLPGVVRNRQGAKAARVEAKKLGTLLAGAELSFMRQGIRHVNGIS
jgi:cell division protein FtsJ